MTGILSRWARDPGLVVALLVLTVFGIGVIYSAGVLNIPSPVVTGAWRRQLMWFVIALVAFSVVTRVPMRWIEWAAVPAYIVAIVLLAATLVIGTGAGTAAGVKSWIAVGGFRFQPAEVAKIATVLALARLLAGREEPPMFLRELLAPAALVAVPLGLVMLQPDLGTAQAFIGILFGALFWAGTPVPLLILLASPALGLILSFDTRLWSVYFVVLVVGVYLYGRRHLFLPESLAIVLLNLAAGTIAQPLWNSLAPYQKNRLLVFLDPTVDPGGAGWNVIQSKVAIGSGGLLGKGFTEGTQKRLNFLPEQHTDFIFGVVGEEFGFLGTAIVLLTFLYIFARMIRLAEKSNDPFAGIVVFGILGAWLVHTFVNIGMTIGIVPVMGIPLPFLSYGGSFLLMSWVAAALAIRVVEED
jgi:rod shape determining protein RodA